MLNIIVIVLLGQMVIPFKSRAELSILDERPHGVSLARESPRGALMGYKGLRAAANIARKLKEHVGAQSGKCAVAR